LRAGGPKEDAARNFVEESLLGVSRRFVKKFQPKEEDEDVDGRDGEKPKEKEGDKKKTRESGRDEAGVIRGYERFGEVCKDLNEIIDVLWISATRKHCNFPSAAFKSATAALTRPATASLQIPYLLNIANVIADYLPSFPPAPTPTFTLLRKLDYIFASLLSGYGLDSGTPLPSVVDGQGGLSRTDMVRCRSLIERTRVTVVDVMGGAEEDYDDQPSEEELVEMDAQGEVDVDMDGEAKGGVEKEERPWNGLEDDDDEDEDRLEMDVARVYEKSLMKLGELLGDELVRTMEDSMADVPGWRQSE
jgi:hypothetical protein